MARATQERSEGSAALPPPGHARREVKRRRTDELAEQAEAAAEDTGRIDPKALRIDNEIAQHFNDLEVSNQDPAYRYGWVNSGFYGRFIKAKLADGWEVVQGDMVEAIELKGVGGDTTRRIGDVILMRCRLDIFMRLQRRERAVREARDQVATAGLRELGDRHRGRGVIVHEGDTMSPRVARTMAQRAEARSTALKGMDTRIRAGQMPGVRAPGA